MTRRISLRDEHLRISDARVLQLIEELLREDFLFLPRADFAIEVHEQDVAPIQRRIAAIKQRLVLRYQCQDG